MKHWNLKTSGMDLLSIKIQEMEKELSEFQRRLEEDRKKSMNIELEINEVQTLNSTINCVLNHESRITEESRAHLKKIHDVYQSLSLRSNAQDLQYATSNRIEELLQKKAKLESQLAHVKLKRGKEQEKLEEIRMQVMIQKNKKKAILLKLQKSVENSEAARNQAFAKFMKLKK